jgi:hypothetical protein
VRYIVGTVDNSCVPCLGLPSSSVASVYLNTVAFECRFNDWLCCAKPCQ